MSNFGKLSIPNHLEIKLGLLMHVFLFILLFNINGTAQTFEMSGTDTINMVDVNNMKQGHWVYFGKMKQLPGYEPDQKVEEGDFENNRKTGLWYKFFPNNNPMSEITFTNNRPNGPYKTYYDNGSIQEEGVWKNNRNVGEFQRFYENGEKQQQFVFNGTGKREGQQTYYHDNGKVMIEGKWDGGKEDGEIKEYHYNGDLKSVKVFAEGGIDKEKTQTFEPKKEVIEPKPEVKPVEADKQVVVVDTKKVTRNIGVFDANGFNTLYNKNRQIQQKGEFKNGKLYNGKWYKYNEDGILESIEIYKNGRYVGEGVIEDE